LARDCWLRQHFGEWVVAVHEIGKAGRARIGMPLIRRREVAIVLLLRPLGSRRHLAIIEALALLGIAQEVISACYLLELLFAPLSPGLRSG
jgi:hypothetical protein